MKVNPFRLAHLLATFETSAVSLTVRTPAITGLNDPTNSPLVFVSYAVHFLQISKLLI